LPQIALAAFQVLQRHFSMKRTLAMARQTRKVSASLSCLFLALSWSFGSAVDGVRPSRGLRGKPLKRAEPENRRELSKKKTKKSKSPKGSERLSSVSERMIVRCKPQISDENCLEQLSTAGENLAVIHSLPSFHSFAIEGDLATREDLQRMGIDVVPDYERVPFVLEDSYHRSLDSTSYGVDLIRATEVWEQYGVTGEGVKICVLDTGVDATHPDFADSTLSGYDGGDGGLFDNPWYEDTSVSRSHGTHITGIIASSNVEAGYVGVAPGAEIYMVNLYNRNNRFFSSDILEAVQLCKEVGANIISVSAGGTDFSETEEEAFEQLYNDGIITVAASGNSGGSDSMYPACYDKVISVAASNSNDAIAQFSTINSFTNIAAPGK
jgi:subtilisin family serine protease